mgnify:CR=1 FL=1
MSTPVFADDFSDSNYWLENREHCEPSTLPTKADTVVIGSGLTGASAAHALASAERSVVVIDRNQIGSGASSRNTGMIGKGSRLGFAPLAKVAGHEAAITYFKELDAIYHEAIDRIEKENFDCNFRRSGRFIGALRPEHLERLMREYEAREKFLGEKVKFVRGAPTEIVGSERYFGGVLLDSAASVDPAAYTAAMVSRAAAIGAQFIPETAALAVKRDINGHEVHTSRGTVRCRNVVVATNGYGGRELPYAHARLLPISAYVVTTEELPAELLDSIFLARSTYVDNTRATRYFQVTPDGKRLVFGSRTGRRPPGSLRAVARKIRQDMTFLFPQLADVKLSRVWTGRCAATLDLSPRLVEHEGVHYAIGYSFTGLALAPYLGRLAGEWIVTGKRPDTAFSKGDFPTLPIRARILRPLAAPILTRYYAWEDRPFIQSRS